MGNNKESPLGAVEYSGAAQYRVWLDCIFLSSENWLFWMLGECGSVALKGEEFFRSIGVNCIFLGGGRLKLVADS